MSHQTVQIDFMIFAGHDDQKETSKGAQISEVYVSLSFILRQKQNLRSQKMSYLSAYLFRKQLTLHKDQVVNYLQL